MKKSIIFIIATALICGCASYSSSALVALDSRSVKSETSGCEFTVAAKAFDRMDCQRFFDRNILEKGYQPIQIFVRNDTNKTYTFDPSKMSMPVADASMVAKMVHTNTGGRVAGYTAGAFLLAPVLLIPAAVDGVKSKNANELLDADFHAKSAKIKDLAPGESMNAVVFVKSSDYQGDFTITLQARGSWSYEVVPMSVRA